MIRENYSSFWFHDSVECLSLNYHDLRASLSLDSGAF